MESRNLSRRKRCEAWDKILEMWMNYPENIPHTVRKSNAIFT